MMKLLSILCGFLVVLETHAILRTDFVLKTEINEQQAYKKLYSCSSQEEEGSCLCDERDKAGSRLIGNCHNGECVSCKELSGEDKIVDIKSATK